MSSVFARTVVGQDAPNPVTRLHDDLFNQEPAPVDRIAQHLLTCRDILIYWRKLLIPVVTKRIAAESVLNDPAHAEHPARPTWEAKYDALLDEECEHLVHVLWEAYHIGRLWDALNVRDRVTHGVHTALGLDARETNVGKTLAFADRGPIQRAATLPPQYRYPDTLRLILPTQIALMIEECPF